MPEVVIYKYPIERTDEQFVDIPVGAKFLSLQSQADRPVLWFEVDPDVAGIEQLPVAIVMTGAYFDPKGWHYLGTVQMLQGRIVAHVYTGRDLR